MTYPLTTADVVEMLTPILKTKEDLNSRLVKAEQEAKKASENMYDGFPCGGAWLEMSGHHPLVKAFKKFGVLEDERNKEYRFVTSTGGRWKMNKAYYGTGYHLSGYGFTRLTQNMNIATAECSAMVTALGLSGITVHTYID